MGVYKNALLERRDRRAGGSGTIREADYGLAHGEAIKRAVESMARLGGAIRFGYTRDRGAYAIGIYCNGDYTTQYCPGNEDINAWLNQLADDVDEVTPAVLAQASTGDVAKRARKGKEGR